MADIARIAVFDERVVQKNPTHFAVSQGGQSISATSFSAISATASQHTYQIQVPSLNVFVDRAIEWTSTCNLSFDVDTTGAILCPLGGQVSLAPFPLHQLTSTLSATINDATVSINTSDCLDQILRLADSSRNRESRTCPTYLDTLKSYSTVSSMNPINGYGDATTNGTIPNGAFYNVQFLNPTSGAVLSGSGSYVYGGATVAYVDGVPVKAGSTPVAQTTKYPIVLQFTSTEKLVLSPFIFSETHEGETGLFSVQNIQIVANMQAPSSDNTDLSGRVLRYGVGNGFNSITNIKYWTTPFSGASVNCVFITPSLSLPLPSKSIVPYQNFARYTQNIGVSVAPNQLSSQLQSQTITLPTIPELIVLSARPNVYAGSDASFYLPIQSISCNMDNFSGLLSSFSPAQLYSMSKNNGLDMEWNQWNGNAYSNGAYVALVGGMIVIKPSKDIALSTGLAPSVSGNYVFQFNFSVLNTSGVPLTGLQLTTMAVNSGYFESIAGSSRVLQSVLSQKDVIEADAKGSVTSSDLTRYVGGGVSSLGKHLSNSIQRALPLIRSLAPMLKPMLPKEAQDVMSAVGLGRKSLQKRLM